MVGAYADCVKNRANYDISADLSAFQDGEAYVQSVFSWIKDRPEVKAALRWAWNNYGKDAIQGILNEMEVGSAEATAAVLGAFAAGMGIGTAIDALAECA